MNDRVRMSKAGVRKLEIELKRMKFEERPAIVAEIKRARELGDLSENAEYHAAKEKQTHIERKISEIEYKLSQVEILDTDNIPDDKVYLFAKVLVEDVDDGEQLEYTIVPPDETDIDNDVISVHSPIGKGLLGKAVGEIAEFQVPRGTMKYKILKITRE